ncbi:uncharacterized protein [Palaemon carinicauda]|uniref:uncharacterized protein isoform X2 n=1 Tax=Palaemon carinicauda TaxID=392227 RepID=UPI0035B62145
MSTGCWQSGSLTVALSQATVYHKFLYRIFIKTNKQVSNFALARSNDGIYPIPSSLLLVLVEVFKLLVILIWSKVTGIQMEGWSPSIRFSLPAVCYFLTNFMYLGALTKISPPIWMVLIQTRTLYTAVAYKIVFGREVTYVQGMGCILVVCSVSVARLSAIGDGQTALPFFVLFISQLAAILSTVASICVEVLLKNDGRSFCEQQWWLYVWGSFLGLLFMILKEDIPKLVTDVQEVLDNWHQMSLLWLSIITTSFAGLCIPHVVKNLDTIVKDYLGASNNLLLSVVIGALFPAEFTISWLYVLSLVILVAGIWLYEKKTL